MYTCEPYEPYLNWAIWWKCVQDCKEGYGATESPLDGGRAELCIQWLPLPCERLL